MRENGEAMNGEESPSNIFEQAGKNKGVKKDQPPEKVLPKLTREELEKLIQDVYQQHDQFERRLDELYQKSGFSPHTISQYLGNPQNLSEAQRKVLEERRNRLKRELGFKKGKEVKIKPKESDDTTAKRKGKTLGGRKGWISM